MASDIQTASDETEEATPQRGATRAPVKRPVRLQFDDAIDIVEARCHNVSIGGMFVHSKEGRPVGSLVRFELLLDDDASIRGLAEVVWMRAQDHGPERMAGMGLKFRFLEQRDRQLIFKLVSQHIKERLAARHPGLGDAEDDEEPAGPPPIRAPASTVERVSKPSGGAASSPDEADGADGADEPRRDVLPSVDDLDDEPARDVAAASVGSQDAGERPRRRPAPRAASDDESGQRSLLFREDDAGDDDEGSAVSASGEATGAWLHEGLQNGSGGFESRAGFGGGTEAADSYDSYDSNDSYDSYDAQDVDADHESDLYGEDSHFEHRPKPRRDVPILALAAVLVTALAVSAYLWGDRFFDRGGDDVAPAPLSQAAEDGSAVADDPVAEGADASAGTEREPSGPASQPTPPADQAVREAPPPEPRPSGEAESERATPSRPFRTVRDISARVAGAEVEIVITTDGRVAEERYSHSRLPEGAPRELIRLRGLGERFTTERIPVGIGAVRQVRTGWHRKSSGNELHVVIDLSDESARLTGLRVEGNRLIARIKG